MSSSFPGSHQEYRTAAPAGISVLGTAAPLLDRRVLEDMERDFPDSTVVARFADDFCATLQGKLDRLGAALGGGDRVDAHDAVLSLTSSAAMVGAQRLSQAARATERQIAAGDLEAAARSLALLCGCGIETRQELQRTYLTHH